MVSDREVLGLFIRQVTEMRTLQQKSADKRNQTAAVKARNAEDIVDKALRVLAANGYVPLHWKQGELL